MSFSSSPARPPVDAHGADRAEDVAAVRFSHTTHEEPVDYRALESPEEAGVVSDATLFRAPPATAAGTAPPADPVTKPSSPRNRDDRRGAPRRSSRSRRRRR